MSDKNSKGTSSTSNAKVANRGGYTPGMKGGYTPSNNTPVNQTPTPPPTGSGESKK